MLKNNSEVKAAKGSTLEIEGITDHEMSVKIMNNTSTCLRLKDIYNTYGRYRLQDLVYI